MEQNNNIPYSDSFGDIELEVLSEYFPNDEYSTNEPPKSPLREYAEFMFLGLLPVLAITFFPFGLFVLVVYLIVNLFVLFLP